MRFLTSIVLVTLTSISANALDSCEEVSERISKIARNSRMDVVVLRQKANQTVVYDFIFKQASARVVCDRDQVIANEGAAVRAKSWRFDTRENGKVVYDRPIYLITSIVIAGFLPSVGIHNPAETCDKAQAGKTTHIDRFAEGFQIQCQFDDQLAHVVLDFN